MRWRGGIRAVFTCSTSARVNVTRFPLARSPSVPDGSRLPEFMIENFASLIPRSLLSESGSVFYSGRAAFSSPSSLYVLGLNPGGSPVIQATETVAWHTSKVLYDEPDEWSAYADESWGGAPPGTSGLQPRVLHLLRGVGFNPRHVPASNVVFLRSTRENTLGRKFADLADECWAFHRSVIDQLGVRVVLCFGRTAGLCVASRLSARRPVGRFVEMNNRRWRTEAFSNGHGLSVVIATHPSIADWTAPSTDPTPFLRQVLQST